MKMHDDIPEALRQTSAEQIRPRSYRSFWFLGGFGILGIGLGAWFIPQLLSAASNSEPPPIVTAPANNPADSSPTPAHLLGHFQYPEAPPDQLQAIAGESGILLHKAAAAQYEAMAAAAQAAGVTLVPISGFRSVADQKHLFFEVKAERGQDTTQRAEVSAPPGYSEHHTGYAIDLGDANYPEAHLKTDFETTPAFQWLQANAAHFSFELSFPQGNPQGVSYEPWHWRFVGDQDSLETFYKNQEQQARRSSAQ